MADHEKIEEKIERQSEGRSGLVRPIDDRVIAGVCAGIARFFGWPANRVRIVYVAASILSAAFPGILVYLALWLLMPPSTGRRRPFLGPR